MTEPRTVRACPHCDDTSNLRQRTGKQDRDVTDPEYDWYCPRCRRGVDPVEREAYSSGGKRRGVSAMLADPNTTDFKDIES